MYSKEQLKQHIEDLGIKPTDTLLIHSSMKAVGSVNGGADTILDLFIDYLKDGLLIFPTHSWTTITKDGDMFDPKTTPSCVGILSNLFMKRSNVIRSLHPTHSVAAIGKNAVEYISGEEQITTPTSWSGCWGKLYNLDAKILFLGCPLSKNTFIHSVEEHCNIPNRLSKKRIEVKIKMADDTLRNLNIQRHKAPIDDISENYVKLKPALLEKGIATKGYIGDAKSYLCMAKDMADLTKKLLEENPDYFLVN